MNSINVVLTVIIFALFAVAGLLVKFPEKGDDLMVQLTKGQLFSKEGVYTGYVEAVEGMLEQRVPAGGGWKKLAVGEKLISGMEIRTLADSQATIRFDDGSVLRMAEVTQLIFNNRLYQINLELINGMIYNEVGFVSSRKYNIKLADYLAETTSANFAAKNNFQADPELLILREAVDVYLAQEKKGNFRAKNKLCLREQSIEESELSKDELQQQEDLWNLAEK